MRWTLPNLVSDKKKGVSRNSPHQFHQLPYLIKPKTSTPTSQPQKKLCCATPTQTNKNVKKCVRMKEKQTIIITNRNYPKMRLNDKIINIY